MRFRFRLQRMLQFVELREKAKKLEVAALIHAIQVDEAHKIRLEAEARGLLLESRERMRVSIAWLPFANAKVASNVKETQRLERSIASDKTRLLQKQDELGRLSLRRKALESLREKRKAEFRVEEVRKEQTRLDEVFSTNRLRERN